MLVSFRTKGVLRHPYPLCVILEKWVHGVTVGCIFRRWQERFLVKVMSWQPSLAQLCGNSMVSMSLDLILSGLSPAFGPDTAIMLCLLFLAVRYICSLGARLCYTNPDPPRHRHSALNALTKHNNFGPTDSTWIKCKHEFKNFSGSGPECSGFESLNPFSLTCESQCS